MSRPQTQNSMLPPVLVLKMNLSEILVLDQRKTSIQSRPREETNSSSWFGSKEVSESSSGSECEDNVKSWFWAGEEGRYKPRARRKGQCQRQAQGQAGNFH